MTVTNTVPPTISGTATQGQQLLTSNGSWTYSLDYLSYAYQWERCDAFGASCVDIAGATQQRYTLTAADVGSTIRSEVTATEHSNPTPPPSSGPIVITTGGTYVGNWVSNSSTPAVLIQTAQAVIIEDSIVGNTSGGILLTSSTSNADVTIRRTTFNGIPGGKDRAIRGENFASFVVENCTINYTGGIYFLQAPSTLISVTKNAMYNIQGDAGAGKRQFLQLNGISTGTILAEWNQVINTFGQSVAEDVFSVYQTSNAVLRNNYVEGGYPATAGGGHQGTGMLLGDAGGNNNVAHDNQIIGVTNVGIGIAAGNNNHVYDNTVVSDGKTPDGTPLAAANVGIYCYPAYASPPTNCTLYGNMVGYMHAGSPMYRNDEYCPSATNNVPADNSFYYGNHTTAITHADETAQWAVWQTKLTTNGITVGAP